MEKLLALIEKVKSLGFDSTNGYLPIIHGETDKAYFELLPMEDGAKRYFKKSTTVEHDGIYWTQNHKPFIIDQYGNRVTDDEINLFI